MKYGKLIGKGAFSRVYRDGDSDNVTVVSSCPAKDCLAMFPVDGGHFPKVSKLNYDDSKGYVYSMPYYGKTSAAIKGSISPESWKIYQSLRKVSCENRGYYEIREMVETLPESDEKEALLEFVDNFANYCNESMRFEISPRNVRVSNGKLVFLDCFFCADALAQTTRF